MNEVQVFKAFSDPLRIEIVQRLANGSARNINTLTRDLGLTRQGGRRQVQVLVDAGIVFLTPEGRSTKVSLNISSLKAARRFIHKLENQWEVRLEALKKFAETEAQWEDDSKS